MGQTRRMTLDLALNNHHPPVLGDLLTTERAAYVITDIRPVESRVWGNRWKIELRRLPHGSNSRPPLTVGEQRVHPTSTYARGERPADYFAAPRWTDACSEHGDEQDHHGDSESEQDHLD